MNSVASDPAILRVREFAAPAGSVDLRPGRVREAPGALSPWARLLFFSGPGYLVAVGYMDPGNWATALAAGSGFGYKLLSIVILSSLMAMVLQVAAVRLGTVSGLDLAQACRRHFSPRASLLLWIACEVAIIACNLGEVLGMACGLALVFGLPLPAGVFLTVLDVLLVLALQKRGARPLEALIMGLTAIVAACFALQLWWLHPSALAIAGGLLPGSQILTQPQMLYLAVGIVGATVMPHNLYLHSALVQARRSSATQLGVREVTRLAAWDSSIALCLAMVVNAAILILAAGAFHRPGMPSVTEFSQASRLLGPTLGSGMAGRVFGIGLIASGLSSSVTGTLAGQIVMRGFLDIQVSRSLRGLMTRAVAIVPAAVAAVAFGSAGTGRVLVASQMVLGLQLPFAVVPLLWFTTRRKSLGTHAFSGPFGALLWGVAALILALNGWMLATAL